MRNGPVTTAILDKVEAYYREKLERFGAGPRGVDWNDGESQDLRFRQLLQLCEVDRQFTINDLGCGYGALLAHLARRNLPFSYRGFDISPAMIAAARQTFGRLANASFEEAGRPMTPADYTVASGIFNVKLDTPAPEWLEYVLATLDSMDDASREGFAFNCLTVYSDAGRMREDLYYGDPCFLFDYCKRRFSKHVALLHDYGLHEFTLLVRKRI